MNLTTLYSKKTVTYKHGECNLQLKISQELFSSLDIDHGTQRLLRTLLFENINSYKKVLDLGCGYGPIAIAMKKVCPSAEVHAVDVDALALAFTKENAQLNDIEDMQVYASFGYGQVTDVDFDIIVSNIPAKVGEKALKHILKDAENHLTNNGKVIVVVIDAIADFVREQLEGDEDITITYHRSWLGHHVYHYQFVADQRNSANSHLAFESGIAFRGSQEFLNLSGKYSFDTSYGLPEFDQVSHATKLLARVLSRITDSVKSAMCFHVGQGHVPLFVAKHFGLSSVELIDRNLLALKTSEHNLAKYRITAELNHSVLPLSKIRHDVVAGIIPEKQSQEVYAAYLTSLSESLQSGGKAIIVSSSTTITRIEDSVKSDFEILYREKKNGSTVLVLQNEKARN